jgi:hypothetical protein
VLKLSLAKGSLSLLIFISATLPSTIVPVALAQTGAELDARNRIVTTVLGQGARPRQLNEASARLAAMETALRTFLAQSTPVEQEGSRKQLFDAIGKPQGLELFRALISGQADTAQRSRWILAANAALEHPPSDGSSSGLTMNFFSGRESLLNLLSLTGSDETAIQLGTGLVRQTQQGYLWRIGIVDGQELANQLLEGIESEAQRPNSMLTGVRKMLVLKAIYQEAARWVQVDSIGEVERIYFSALMSKLRDYAPAEAAPPSSNTQAQAEPPAQPPAQPLAQPAQPSHAASLLIPIIFLMLAVAAVAVYRFRARIPWRNVFSEPEPAPVSPPKFVPALADLSEEDIKGKRVLVRVDLDILDVDGTLVPMGPLQMQQTLTVVRELLKRRASKIILAAHTHRDLPMGYVRRCLEELSDKEALDQKQRKLRFKVFNKAEGGRRQELIEKEADGTVILLDNLAADDNEGAEEPEDRAALARELAQLADVYINDAPDASREARASTVDIVTLVPVVAVGPALAAELQAIAEQPERRQRSSLNKLPAVTAMQRVGYL